MASTSIFSYTSFLVESAMGASSKSFTNQPEKEKTKSTQNVARTAMTTSIDKWAIYSAVRFVLRARRIIYRVTKKDRESNRAPKNPTGN